MTPQLLRLALAFEFLLSLIAIFTAWSEVGGQPVLDQMHWGWKLGLSLAMAASTVGYTSAIVSQEKHWSFRSACWLTAFAISLLAAVAVTSFVALQTDFLDNEEGTTSSALRRTGCVALWLAA